MQLKRIIGTLAILTIIVGIFFNKILNFIVNIQWFKDVGYLAVYLKKFSAQLALGVPIFLACFVIIYIYYLSLRRSYLKRHRIIELDRKKEKIEKLIVVFFDAIVALIISNTVASNYWYQILQYSNSTTFNISDPIFDLDVSFYIFKLPLINSIYSTIMNILILLIIFTIIFSIVKGVNFTIENIINPQRNKKRDLLIFNMFNFKGLGISLKNIMTGYAGKHLALLFSLIMLLLSIGYLIKGYQLVYSSRGVVFGASYTDIHVSLYFYRIIAILSLVSSIVIFLSILASKVKPIMISLALIFVLIIGENIAAVAVENFIVKSNQRDLESPYIKNNIELTRKAYNIEGIKEERFSGNKDLNLNDVTENKATIDNIKINSYQPALEFFNQVQSLKYFYNFKDADIDRYNINNKYTQVFVAPREIDVNTLQGNVNTWQGKHLLYTHGYGVAMSKVNSVTSSGKPDFVIKDIPLNNSSNIKVDNPRIYFGEISKDYAIVNNTLGEVDYPEGGENKTFNYDGESGIKMTWLNRLIYAAYEGNINLLLSKDIKTDSKILINRDISSRVKKIAPFLTYDKDPYLVINNGKMYYIVDAYTTSSLYPFSEPYKNINYIRNSVKVIIDAYSGKTDFYIVDKNDPIIETYSKIFPELFKDQSELQPGFKEHFRYPEDLFETQCNILSKYHVTDANTFFDGGDLWQIAINEKEVEGKQQVRESDFQTLKLPNQNKEEMVIMSYFNVKNKDNLSAMIAGRMDGENYGKLELYRLPTDRTVYSSYLFQQSLNQDTVISKEISLLNTQGSKIQYGDPVIIPIKDSLLYVIPLYVRATGENSIPEVKKIVLKNGEKIVMGNNMEEAINLLFGNKQPEKPATDNKSENNASVTANGAKEMYDKMIEAQKKGDWATYGEYLKRLGDMLNTLSK